MKYYNNKDNIEIAYMEPEELNKIYILTKYIWSISFILILSFLIINNYKYLYLNNYLIIKRY